MHVMVRCLLVAGIVAASSVDRISAFSVRPQTPKVPTSFRVDVTGVVPAMFVIPGYASPGDTWKATVARFQNTYRCHVPTLAGFAGVPPIQGPLLATVRTELAGHIREHHFDR